MGHRYRLKRHLHPIAVPGEAAYLLSERDVEMLRPEVAQRVVPLLGEPRTVEDIVELLRPDPPSAGEVAHLLDRLLQQGYVRLDDEGQDAFWDLSGLSAAAVRTARVAVVDAGADPEPVAAVLRAEGVTVTGDDPALTVAVCDDYLGPGPARVAAAGRPWVPVKPRGSVVWSGPVFDAATPGCWECMVHRLRANRVAELYVMRATGQSGPAPVPRADLEVSRDLGARLAALDVVRWLGGLREPRRVLTFDVQTMRTAHHPFAARPQCPDCGDPGMTAARTARPVEIRPLAKTEAGRTARAEEVWERYSHLVDPVTGLVRDVRRQRRGPRFLMGHVAGHNFALNARSLGEIRAGLRSMSAGKGRTTVQARTSALCEALERYSGVFHGDELRRTATLEDLGEAGLHPNDCQLYSERQYAGRAEWNRACSPFQRVSEPFDPATPVEWTPLWSLTGGRARYLPTGYLYYNYPWPGPPLAFADSNGNAAGAALEDAVVQGFMEVVERDSVALWWYNRLRMPAVDLDAFADPWLDRLREVYAGLGREVWALDVTADFGLPAFVAVSRRTDGPPEDVMLGFGAHFGAAAALSRALTELNQFLPAVTPGPGPRYAVTDPALVSWWRTATIETDPHLLPDRAAPPTRPGTHADLSGPDLGADVATLAALAEARGLDVLVLDQTRPDVGLPVVKVVVPGMRHFWARFAPGRLFDVPVELGRLPARTPEDALNPVPLFL
uniref:TOMM precursor leader peptide-binding protein n=1 Tax=Herbidospora sakaeratensis TaxID=564415 RepID=UPI000782D79C|nr:TOMM precursor leader peptide-binding protein [Herbidospora sakaeratensis]